MPGSLGAPEVLVFATVFVGGLALPVIALSMIASARGQTQAYVVWGLLSWLGVLMGFLTVPQRRLESPQETTPFGSEGPATPPAVRAESRRSPTPSFGAGIHNEANLAWVSCQRCDNGNPPGSHFCSSCGRPLARIAAPLEGGNRENRHLRTGQVVLGSVFAVLVILVSGIGIYLKFADDDEPPLRSVLLTVDDFPPGWRELIESDASAADPAEACDPGSPPGEKSRVETGDFYESDGVIAVWQIVIQFGTAAEADASVGRARDWGPCLVDAIQSGAFDDDVTSLSDASFVAVQLSPIGRRSEAYLFTVAARSGKEGRVQYLSMVYFSVGKRASSLSMFSDGFEPDFAFLESLALRAAAKAAGVASESLPKVAASKNVQPSVLPVKMAPGASWSADDINWDKPVQEQGCKANSSAVQDGIFWCTPSRPASESGGAPHFPYCEPTGEMRSNRSGKTEPGFDCYWFVSGKTWDSFPPQP